MDREVKARRLHRNKITCGITMGDPAGIGPEVLLKALNDKRIQSLANFVIIGNPQLLKKTAQALKIKLSSKNTLVDAGKINKLIPLECINKALRLIRSKQIDVLVTAPVNKAVINRALLQQVRGQAGCCFQGHTEYLAKATKSKHFAMMLIGGALKVVLATRHIALKDVPRALTKQKVYQTLRLSSLALRKYFGLAKPRIAVCALNPHCGEGQMMGKEEAKIIRPAIEQARSFAKIMGPFSADTIFYSAVCGQFDAVVAMYHDQGLIPLKTLFLHQGVNLTLGLPFVRTSPDHGTAYEIAGKNQANPGSMKAAIELAVKIATNIKK